LCGPIDEKPVVLPTGKMDDSNDMTQRAFIISIGRQRFEIRIRVNTTITQVRPRSTQRLIPIDRDSLVRKAGKKGNKGKAAFMLSLQSYNGFVVRAI
jgi:hypothetical protein